VLLPAEDSLSVSFASALFMLDFRRMQMSTPMCVRRLPGQTFKQHRRPTELPLGLAVPGGSSGARSWHDAAQASPLLTLEPAQHRLVWLEFA
jgi:hypothetical protein